MTRDAAADSHQLTVRARPAARAAADEKAADAARACYREGAMKSLPVNKRIASLLEPDERVVAVHRSAVIDRREPTAGPHITAGLTGALYVTSRQVVLVGGSTCAIELDAIEEAVLSGEQLRLILHDGHGVTLRVAQPRLLRVEIAAARAAARAVAVPIVGPDSQPESR